MPEQTYITSETIERFRSYLYSGEKSAFTVDKYIRDVRAFAKFLDGEAVTKEKTLAYKKHLIECGGFAGSSINSMIASIRALLKFLGRLDCAVTSIRIQEMPFCPEDRSLSHNEFLHLLDAARDDARLSLLLQVIFSTGIRVSELRYFTAEAFRGARGSVRVMVSCKKKDRYVLVADELKKKIARYMKENNIKSGPIFCTRGGKPLDRSYIWKQMKGLCARARVDPGKVFPHNLRKLFARTYYEKYRDIVQLACLLGHSSINTTRIYVKTTEGEVRGRVERMVRLSFENIQKNTTLSA